MYLLFATVAFVIAVGLSVTEIGRRDRARRQRRGTRPEYRSGQKHYLISDWATSCDKSLAWSQQRRKRSS